MTEAQKKQADAIFAGLADLEPAQREVVLAYVQGMTAAVQMLAAKTA